MKSIQDLPIELIDEILSYCKHDILTFSQINKYFNAFKLEFLRRLFTNHSLIVDDVCILRTYKTILKYNYRIFESFGYHPKQSKNSTTRNHNNLLKKATSNNHYVIIKLLTKTLINSKFKYNLAFNWAISTNHIDLVVFILKNKTSFTGKIDLSIRNCQALRLAVMHNRIEVARILIDYDPKMLKASSMPFENAIRQDNKPMIELFIKKRAQIKYWNGVWKLDSVIRWCIDEDHADTLELIIAQHTEDLHYNQEFYFYECVRNGRVSLCQILAKHGCYLHHTKYESVFDLFLTQSVFLGGQHVEYAISIIEFESNFEVMSKIFLKVIFKGHISLAKLFIERCKRLVQVSDNKALQTCADRNHHELAQLLIDNGADVHANRDASICLAAYKNHIQVMKVLIKAGIDIHTVNDEALRYACEYGYYDAVKLLVQNGANICASNAIQYATLFGHTDIIKYLDEYLQIVRMNNRFSSQFSF